MFSDSQQPSRQTLHQITSMSKSPHGLFLSGARPNAQNTTLESKIHSWTLAARATEFCKGVLKLECNGSHFSCKGSGSQKSGDGAPLARTIAICMFQSCAHQDFPDDIWNTKYTATSRAAILAAAAFSACVCITGVGCWCRCQRLILMSTIDARYASRCPFLIIHMACWCWWLMLMIPVDAPFWCPYSELMPPLDAPCWCPLQSWWPLLMPIVDSWCWWLMLMLPIDAPSSPHMVH